MASLADNAILASGAELFVATRERNLSDFDLAPLGVPVKHHFDPLKSGSLGFHRLLKKLDQACFGPTGMPMPNWMYLAGTELTGVTSGIGFPREACPEGLCEALEVPASYSGFVPFAVFMTIPTYRDGTWFAHNLASLGPQLSGEWPGLGGLTKALGLKMVRAEQQVGATQWDSVALHVHTRLGALELLTAFTPAHSDDMTLTYLAEISDASLESLIGPERMAIEETATEWVRAEDHERIRRLQAELEDGIGYCIAGKPEGKGAEQRTPISLRARTP